MKNALDRLTEPVLAPRYKGVRGWLLFLCISMTILYPLEVMVGHGALGEDIWHPTVPMIFDLAIATWSVYVGISLWRVRPNAVMKASVFLWSLSGLNILLAVLILRGPGDYPDGQSKAFLSCIGTILWSTARVAYLESSKRVKATYHGIEPAPDKLNERLLRDMEECMAEADNKTPTTEDVLLSPAFGLGCYVSRRWRSEASVAPLALKGRSRG